LYDVLPIFRQTANRIADPQVRNRGAIVLAARSPNGDFNIVIRNYWPKKEALDGTYKNPSIKRVE
jgi:hypothetical protein